MRRSYMEEVQWGKTQETLKQREANSCVHKGAMCIVRREDEYPNRLLRQLWVKQRTYSVNPVSTQEVIMNRKQLKYAIKLTK
jgi:hypothetical protein